MKYDQQFLEQHYPEVEDNKLKTLWQRYLASSPKYRNLLKGLRLCGSQVVPAFGKVSVVTNGVRSKFTGITTCKSPWACPHCTARVMAQKGTDIGAAIDALAKWYNQKAFMMTLTMPHGRVLSAHDSFAILRDAWRRFVRCGNKRSSARYDRKKYGKEVDYRGNDALAALREDLSIRHIIRVYEFTWSEGNGWHPHMHCLFFVPAKNFNKVLDYEERLFDRWWVCLRKATAAHFKDVYDPQELKERIDDYYADWRKYPQTGHRSLFMSKNKDGSLRRIESSYYIAGWGGDFETTAERLKQARNGHFTPYQIISKAASEPDAEKWFKLYAEYADATRGHRRVEFSKSQESKLNQIVKKWKESEHYIAAIKKKCTWDSPREVCWLRPEQWCTVLMIDQYTDRFLTSEILRKARAPDGYEQIRELLLPLGIDIDRNPLGWTPSGKNFVVANGMDNGKDVGGATVIQ